MINGKQNIICIFRLSREDYDQIINLANICDSYDSTDLSINLNIDKLINRTYTEENDILYYYDNKLVGYLGIYPYKSDSVEISGMIHPDFRKQGIFKKLFSNAVDICRKRKIKFIYLINEQVSVQGRKFALGTGAFLEYTTFLMQYDTIHNKEIKEIHTDIILSEIEEDDIDDVVKICMQGFNLKYEEAIMYIKNCVENPSRVVYVAKCDKIKVGTIIVIMQNNKALLSNFAVHKNFRGKGIGKAILLEITNQLLKNQIQDILLGVETQNIDALKLYETCGFKIERAYDYYKMSL